MSSGAGNARGCGLWAGTTWPLFDNAMGVSKDQIALLLGQIIATFNDEEVARAWLGRQLSV